MRQAAEALDDAALGGLDLKEAAREPQHDSNDDDHEHERAALGAAGAKERLQAALPFLHALIQARAAAGPPTPRTLLTAAGLIPSHRNIMECCAPVYRKL